VGWTTCKEGTAWVMEIEVKTIKLRRGQLREGWSRLGKGGVKFTFWACGSVKRLKG
jgi:hypothetical protein